MELHQIHVHYQPGQDRLLAKFSFNDAAADQARQEIRCFLTRRITMRLWPAMLESMSKQVAINQPASAMFSKDIVQMEHQSSVVLLEQNGGFSTPYQEQVQTWPLGETPLLLETIQIHVQQDQPIQFEFVPLTDTGFSINLTPVVLHAFCKLLQTAVTEADWGFELEMPVTDQNALPAHRLN
ncbi:hypothetical protein LPB67_04980 [Undibacterium sp. Jales W-56]|uniref:hypothetical protein n=1 Tax=Undibacterium sp. Jales W-56 TaxID=2897325 RepID=UPI0021CFF3B7|nr:hypothetical protein [Undibacterium sp. Jales W-56]MCU6433128.1 hypothetical protein [Undibacterium sp. Jales W-56]